MNYKHTLNYYNKTIDNKWKHTKTENMGIVKQGKDKRVHIYEKIGDNK